MNFKKIMIVLIIVSILLLAGCTSNKEMPTLKSGVRVTEQGDDYCNLLWEVENVSDIKATFIDGNIESYEIKNTNTGKTYVNTENNVDITLKNGGQYEHGILLTNLEKGNYNVSFTAKSEEGTIPTMKMTFEIK